MSIYEEFNEIKNQEDYLRVKNGLYKNIEMRREQESELKRLGLDDSQVLVAMAPTNQAIACAQVSITQWETSV